VSASLLDANVWVAATFPRHEFHQVAQQFLATVSEASPAVLCRTTEQSFLRLATSPSLLTRYDQPLRTNRDALDGLKLLLARPDVRHLDEPPGTVALWHRLAARDTASPKVWMDAYLAAFAISGGLAFVTLDRDFQTYEPHGLQLRLLAPPALA
jgi:uncharacterized protein